MDVLLVIGYDHAKHDRNLFNTTIKQLAVSEITLSHCKYTFSMKEVTSVGCVVSAQNIRYDAKRLCDVFAKGLHRIGLYFC